MKSKHNKKKKNAKLLYIFIFLIGASCLSVAISALVLHKKQIIEKMPDELLVEYMNHIPKKEYEEMYSMISIEASNNLSQEEFILTSLLVSLST